MLKHALVVMTSALILTCGGRASTAQVVMPQPSQQQSQEGSGGGLGYEG